MDYKNIRVESADGITVCWFDRPDVRNALSAEMVGEIHTFVSTVSTDEQTRVVIFAGAGGRAFVSGADIAQLRDRGRADALRRINAGLFRRIEQLPQPSIAAITGYALGGGCELALACDLRICGESAKLGQPEVGLGIIPGAGATYRLPRLVGLGRAKELIYTGRIISADEARRIGLVEQVVPDAQVLDAARRLAVEIGHNSTLAVRLAKTALNTGVSIDPDAAMALESATQAILFEDEEKRRRMTAFLERKAGSKR